MSYWQQRAAGYPGSAEEEQALPAAQSQDGGVQRHAVRTSG